MPKTRTKRPTVKDRIVQDTCDKIAAWLEMTHYSIASQHIAAKIRKGDWKNGPFR